MWEKSYSTQALKIVLDAAKKYNAQTWLLDLHNTILPMYNPYATVSADGDDNIRKIRDRLNWADAFVLGSPDNHGFIFGVLKNFLDYYFNNLLEKPLQFWICSNIYALNITS